MKDTIAQKHGPVTIGIDVSKAILDVHLHPEGLRERFANDSAGHALLTGWATSHQPERVIFEATGAYHRALETALGQAGLPLVKINPARRPAALPRPAAPGSRPTRLTFSHGNATGPSDHGYECWRGWLQPCSLT